MSIGNFDTNLSGSEIIPPNSTMILKATSQYPLTYADLTFNYGTTATNQPLTTSAQYFVNNTLDSSISTSSSINSSQIVNFSSDWDQKYYTNNNTRLLYILDDTNSTTDIRLYNATTNALITQVGGNYNAMGYDLQRYAYLYLSYTLYRLDTHATTPSWTQVRDTMYSAGANSSYPRMCVSQGDNQVVLFSGTQNSNTGVLRLSDNRYNIINNIASTFTQSNSRSAVGWDSVNNRYLLACKQGSTVNLYHFTLTTDSNSIAATSITTFTATNSTTSGFC
jgi:hypothetical protein